MDPKISVIVPVYNVEKYILRCLNSIAFQTFKDYEIIIVDDGSTDNSANIVKDFIKSHQDIRINFVRQENAGLSMARNVALPKALGKYICFIDSDDFIETTMLEKLYTKAIDTKSDVVVCNLKKVFEDGTEEVITQFVNLSDDITKNYMLSSPSAGGKLIKTSLLLDNNLFFTKGIYYEDLAVVPAYGLYTNKIEYVDESLYCYFQRANSIMHEPKYNVKFEHIFISLDNLTNIFKNSNAYNKYIEELEYIYIEHLLHAACIRFLPFKEGEKSIDKIIEIMKTDWPNFSRNKYFKKCGIKYRMVCQLFYKKRLKLLKRLLKV